MTKVIVFCIAILILLGGGYFLLHHVSPAVVSPSAMPVSVNSHAADSPPPQELLAKPKPRDLPSGMKEYRNARFHFSLLYPADLQVVEDPRADALTVAFQNADTNDAKGFQIFIQPYTLKQVSDARFKKDLPSGVRQDVTSVTIDGVSGAAFHSVDASLGETREIWFIQNGLLYEATAPRPLESWFEGIMQSWQFI